MGGGGGIDENTDIFSPRLLLLFDCYLSVVCHLVLLVCVICFNFACHLLATKYCSFGLYNKIAPKKVIFGTEYEIDIYVIKKNRRLDNGNKPTERLCFQVCELLYLGPILSAESVSNASGARNLQLQLPIWLEP